MTKRLLLIALCACSNPDAPAPAAKPSIFEGEGKPEPPESATVEAPTGGLRFVDHAPAGLGELRHQAGRHPERWIPEIMSGGGGLLDLNRDGALDLVLVDSGELDPEGARAAAPRIFFGDGKGQFTAAGDPWQVTAQGYGMGLAAGDFDGDGWTDLYLTTFDGRDRLLRNRAGQGLEDVTAAWGLEPAGWSTSAAFFDADRDGDLDLYVGRYIDYTLDEAIKCWFRAIHVYCTPNLYEPLADRLYLNQGGRFLLSTDPVWAANATKTLALATGDLDDDGDTDLYIASDTSQNLLLLNRGDGRFDERAIVSGVAFSKLGREEASMGVAVADSDADGRWDLAVTNFQAEATSLYVRHPRGHYRERSDAAGIGASSRARLSFGIEFFDADNDGDEDLVVANGHIADNVASYREHVTFAQRNSLYQRTAPGRFVELSEEVGPAFAHEGVSRGLAVGDFDADGGVDLLVVDNDGRVMLARNDTPHRGHWLNLWLDGPAIGAQLELQVGERVMRREVRGASSYLSVSDRRVHFGLGDADAVDRLEIRWPDGRVQELPKLEVDRHWRVIPGEPPRPYEPAQGIQAPPSNDAAKAL